MSDATATANFVEDRSDWALLAMRLALGSLFLARATTNWGWFGGNDPAGMSGLEQFLQILGYDSRTALSWLLTATELMAGLLLIAGLAVPLAAAGVIGIALNGAFVLSWEGGFVAGYGGWIVYMAMAAALALLGPGRFALDRFVPWRSFGASKQWVVGPRAGLVGIVAGLVVGVVVITAVGPGFGSAPGFGPPSGAATGGDLARWCELVGEVRQTVVAGGTLPAETFDEFAQTAPDEISPSTRTAAAAFKESVATAFEKPGVAVAVDKIEAYAGRNCG